MSIQCVLAILLKSFHRFLVIIIVVDPHCNRTRACLDVQICEIHTCRKVPNNAHQQLQIMPSRVRCIRLVKTHCFPIFLPQMVGWDILWCSALEWLPVTTPASPHCQHCTRGGGCSSLSARKGLSPSLLALLALTISPYQLLAIYWSPYRPLSPHTVREVNFKGV